MVEQIQLLILKGALGLLSALVCLGLIAALFRPLSAAFSRLRRAVGVFGLVVLAAFATVTAIYADKPGPGNGPLGAPGCSSSGGLVASAPPVGDDPEGEDADDDAAALRITGFAVRSNVVEIASSSRGDVDLMFRSLMWSEHLTSNDWACVEWWRDFTGTTNDAHTVVLPAAVTTAPAAFFTLRGHVSGGDADGDGLSNGEELGFGTDPTRADTDADGLSDSEELGRAEILPDADFLWFDVTGSEYGGDWNWYPSTGHSWIEMDRPVSLGGVETVRAAAFQDGFVHFLPVADDDACLHGSGRDAAGDPLSLRTVPMCSGGVTVAPFNMPTDLNGVAGSGIRYGLVETNGVEYNVVEFVGFGPRNGFDFATPQRLTCEIILPVAETDVVYVSYHTVDDAFRLGCGELGVQCPDRPNPLVPSELYALVAPLEPTNLVAGTTLRYRIGAGTDPTLADTDGDCAPDGRDPYPLDASRAYFGQGADWVRANFTNAEEILEVGYADWVDAQVGTGLENGLYKLTVTVPSVPQSPVAFTVGDLVVVATNSGEYVFLLEKGANYPLAVSSSEAADLVWTAADDIQRPLMRQLQDAPSSESAWTVGGNDLMLRKPFWNLDGFLRWNPKLQGSPNVSRIGPVETRCTFTANLIDYRYARSAIFRWSGGDADIRILDPDDRETVIEVVGMPSWRSLDISVSTDVFGQTLTSTLEGLVVGENDTPQIHLDLSVPQAVFLNEDAGGADLLAPMSLTCSSDVPTNGTYVLSCTSDGGLVRLWDTRGKTHPESYHQSWSASEDCSYSAFVEGVEKSLSLGDVTFCLAYKDASGVTRSSVTRTLTVVKVGNVVLPGEPPLGLIVLRGTSVAMEVGCEPLSSESFIETVFEICKLKAGHSVSDWSNVALNLHGGSAVFSPQNGGIYKLRARVSMSGAGSVERRYLWQMDEDPLLGRQKTGDERAFGVVDESWQVELRDLALTYLGNSAYGEDVDLPATDTYSSYASGRPKCNIFVAHLLERLEFSPPVSHRPHVVYAYPPLASEWKDESFVIPDWERLPDEADPQPGYISSTGSHVGILDFDGNAISAQDYITRRSSATRTGGNFRRYERGY